MRRVFEILRTTALRPMMWLMGLFLLVCAFGLWELHSASLIEKGTKDERLKLSDGGPVIVRGRVIQTLDDLRKATEAANGRPVQIHLQELISDEEGKLASPARGAVRHIGDDDINRVATALADLKFPVNVEAIDAGYWGSHPSFLKMIGRQISLKRLGFLTAMDSEPLDLSQLIGLEQLETLDLGLVARTTSFASLVELPRLESLVLRTHQLLTPENLAHAARIRSLRTIYLPNIAKSPVALDGLSELRASKSLECVYVPVDWSDTTTLAAVQKQIPEINVRASGYAGSRLLAVAAVLGLIVIFGAFGSQVMAQFSLPNSYLTPGFRAWHQFVSWTLIALATLGFASVLIAFGVYWLPAFGVTTLGMTGWLFLCFVEPARIPERRLPPNLRFLVGCLFLTAVVSSLIAMWRNPASVDRLLLTGKQVPCAMLFASVGLVFVRVRTLNQLCRNSYESVVRPALSIQESQQIAMQMNDLTEKSLSAKLRNPFESRTRFWAGFGFLGLAAAVIATFAPSILPDGRATGYANQLCFTAAAVAVLVVAWRWWSLMPYLADMMTRPPSRSEQIRRFFRQLAGELASAIPPSMGLAISGAVAAGAGSFDTRFAGSLALFALAVLVGIYAVIVWLLVIRNVWLAALFSVAVYFVGAMSFVVLLLGFDAPVGFPPPGRIVLAALLVLGAGTIATIFARRYYERRLEWARL